ncbi:hypothetical protein ACIRVF_15495 [Kitasatospora sp. NPDC101157]
MPGPDSGQKQGVQAAESMEVASCLNTTGDLDEWDNAGNASA